MVGAGLTGVYCALTRKVRWVTVLAFVVFVAFFVCMSTTDRHTNQPVWGYPVLLGFALGMTLTTLITIAQLSTPPQLISIASGLVISIRSLGGTIGIAVYNALFNGQVRHLSSKLTQVVLDEGLQRDYVQDFVDGISDQNKTALAGIPGMTNAIMKAGQITSQEMHVLAFRHVWIAAGCFVTLAAVVSIFLHDRETEFSMQIDAPVEPPPKTKAYP